MSKTEWPFAASLPLRLVDYPGVRKLAGFRLLFYHQFILKVLGASIALLVFYKDFFLAGTMPRH